MKGHINLDGFWVVDSPLPFHTLERSIENMDRTLAIYLRPTQEFKSSTQEYREYSDIKERVRRCLPERDFSDGFTTEELKRRDAEKVVIADEYNAYEALFYLCAAERMLELGNREVSWSCINTAEGRLLVAVESHIRDNNELTKQQIAGMAKAASLAQTIEYAALLVRETAKLRAAAWTSRNEAIDVIFPLMEAFIGAYVKSTKKPTIRKDLTRWITTAPDVVAAFKETCSPEALAAGE